MKMRASIIASLLLALVAACGDDRPDVASSGGSGTSLVPAGDGGVGPSVDGGGATTCEAITTEAVPVGEHFVNATEGPAAFGGTLPTGTFVLSDVTRFEPFTGVRDDETGTVTGAPSSDALLSKVLVLDGASYRFTTRSGTIAAGVGAAETTGGTLTTNGTDIAFRQACPTTAATTLLGFSAVGDSIAIYTSSTRRETYVLAP